MCRRQQKDNETHGKYRAVAAVVVDDRAAVVVDDRSIAAIVVDDDRAAVVVDDGTVIYGG